MMMAPTAPAMKNNTAQTCSSRPKLASVSVLAAINPTQAVAISAESRPTAFWIAAAWVASPPPRSRLMAGRARLTTVLSRKATVDTRIATTMTLLVGAASRILPRAVIIAASSD